MWKCWETRNDLCLTPPPTPHYYLYYLLRLGLFVDEVWVTNESGPFWTQTIKQMSIFERGQSCFPSLLPAGDIKINVEDLLL